VYLAHVIYTSGSTGKANGFFVEWAPHLKQGGVSLMFRREGGREFR
jgi:acyl-coenzyme A synthetase/AMP-(fatty) acid ligase